MNGTAFAANFGFAALNTSHALRYRRALSRPRETQERLLRDYLTRNTDTDFGRRHGFGRIRSWQEYADAVPVNTYDDYEEHVDRIARGATGVLTREPVQLLEWSSGSTRAAKLIPFTATLRAEFSRAVGPWIVDLFTRTPGLMGGPAYWSVSPAHDPPTVEGAVVPIGLEDDSQYVGGRLARLVEAALAVPGTVSRITDPALHRRVTLLLLIGCRDLRLISVWHPTFLTLLLDALEADWSELVAGTAEGFEMTSPAITMPPRPARARELERADPGRPESIWPRLGLVSCWADGPARRSADTLRQRLPGTAIQGKGLLATEGVVSIPIGTRRPLAVTSHFFEFLDEEGRAHPAWSLDAGSVYSVLLTTGGGLYRYRLFDRVRVTGHAGATPCIEFVCKEDHVSDLRGEKLSQGFVQDVLDAVLAELSPQPGFAMLAPGSGGGTARYVLFVETLGELPAELADELEVRLRANPHYAHCVAIGQLEAVGVARVGAGAEARYVERLVGLGQRLGDIKPTALSPLEGWGEVFGVG